MLTDHELLNIPTINGKECRAEINWNPMVKGKFLKFTVGNEEVIIPQSAFVRFAMLVAHDDDRDQFIPVKQILVRQYQKNVTIRLKKDLRAGQTITIPVTIDVPRDGQQSDLTLLEL